MSFATCYSLVRFKIEHVTDMHNALPCVAGCTTQACGYRDIYPDFEAANYKVYCLSADTPAAQSKWQTKVRNTSSDLGGHEREYCHDHDPVSWNAEI